MIINKLKTKYCTGFVKLNNKINKILKCELKKVILLLFGIVIV